MRETISALPFTSTAARSGDLWKVPITGGNPATVWETSLGDGDFVPSPDHTRVAMTRKRAGQQGEDLVIRSLSGAQETKVAHDDVSIRDPTWSPDGSQISYIGGATTIPHDSSPSYSGKKLIYANPEYVPGVLFAVSSSGGTPVPIAAKGDYDAFSWVDSNRIVFARQSNLF